ncbi:MAG TPA: wax ester/triacylglycerol synthase family O-acyltransferase [Anaerolineae bacterium]|nr:wax ester/triacylglycerol synthase family O-acyltransferase [Anaerolineae bacterium]
MTPVFPPKNQLSNVDAAWLHMEDPTNLMMVSGIMTFDGPIDFDVFKQLIQHRLLKFDRFRQRVGHAKFPYNASYWEDDPNFELSAHVRHIGLPAPGDQPTLQRFCGELASSPLDFSKPLWQIHLIDNYGDAGCAVMCRFHHAIADGIALMFVFLSITDFTPDAPIIREEDDKKKKKSRGLIGNLYKQTNDMIKTSRKLAQKAVKESLNVMTNPARMLDFAKLGGDGAMSAARLIFRTPDPQTLFKGPLGVSKSVAWTKPIMLKDVKAIRKVTDGTVNDVLLTAMTGALRRYLIEQGEDVDGLNFRAAIPVNLRGPEEMGELGNKFGLVFLSLPVGIEDTFDRLQELKKRMNALKGSTEAVVAFGILNAVGMTTGEIHRIIVNMFGAKVTAVMTNVPGPPMPLYFGGQEIKEVMFWVPQSGRVGLGISILSYAGKVFMGVITDTGIVPNPTSIVDHFYDEFDVLQDLVRQTETPEPQSTKPESVTPSQKPALTPTATIPSPDQCQALTKSGRQCRNRAQADSPFCHIHEPEPEAETETESA